MLSSSKYNVLIGKWTLKEQFARDYRALVFSAPAARIFPKIYPASAIVAEILALAILVYDLPSGTVHLAQEIETKMALTVGEQIEVWGKTTRSLTRGEWQYQSIEFKVVNNKGEDMIAGKTTVMVPYNE